jgi:hypothetical protein
LYEQGYLRRIINIKVVSFFENYKNNFEYHIFLYPFPSYNKNCNQTVGFLGRPLKKGRIFYYEKEDS